MYTPPCAEKVVNFSALRDRIKPWTATIIPGSFDMIHIGHLRAIERSSECAGPMIVVVSSDKRIKIRKGKHSPMISESNRLELLAGLACVDYVVLWKSLSHKAYLDEIRPRRVTFEKDGAHTIGQVKRIDMIHHEYPKTELLFLPRTEQVSTTTEIKSIFKDRYLSDLNHFIPR